MKPIPPGRKANLLAGAAPRGERERRYLARVIAREHARDDVFERLELEALAEKRERETPIAVGPRITGWEDFKRRFAKQHPGTVLDLGNAESRPYDDHAPLFWTLLQEYVPLAERNEYDAEESAIMTERWLIEGRLDPSTTAHPHWFQEDSFLRSPHKMILRLFQTALIFPLAVRYDEAAANEHLEQVGREAKRGRLVLQKIKGRHVWRKFEGKKRR